MKIIALIISCVLLTTSCLNKRVCSSRTAENCNKSTYQLSYDHGLGLGEDSIVLSRDSNFGLFNNVSIYRNKTKIFDHGQFENGINGDKTNLFIEFDVSINHFYYIFKVINGPSPDSYLILENLNGNLSLLGETKPNSAEIFGDIDYDGKFEIGGFENWCIENDSTCHQKELYTVFEVDRFFPKDTLLTNFFNKFVK